MNARAVAHAAHAWRQLSSTVPVDQNRGKAKPAAPTEGDHPSNASSLSRRAWQGVRFLTHSA